jgi:hypothetical protein
MKAVSRIYGNIGFMGLWNGLGVRIVMIGTLTAFQWLMYAIFLRFDLFGPVLILCADTIPSRFSWAFQRLEAIEILSMI